MGEDVTLAAAQVGERFAVAAEAWMDRGGDVPEALVALTNGPDHHLRSPVDELPLIKDRVFGVSVGFKAPRSWPPGHSFDRSTVTTSPVRLEANGAAIIADTASQGPRYEPRPAWLRVDPEDWDLVATWDGWTVYLDLPGEATFVVSASVRWHDGDSLRAGVVVVALSLRQVRD